MFLSYLSIVGLSSPPPRSPTAPVIDRVRVSSKFLFRSVLFPRAPLFLTFPAEPPIFIVRTPSTPPVDLFAGAEPLYFSVTGRFFASQLFPPFVTFGPSLNRSLYSPFGTIQGFPSALPSPQKAISSLVPRPSPFLMSFLG